MAPDEGFFPRRQTPHPSRCRCASAIHLLPQGEKGRRTRNTTLCDCLTGKSPQNLSSPRAKNIPLNPSGKSKLEYAHPVPLEGRIAIVTDVGAGCGGRGNARRARCLQGGDFRERTTRARRRRCCGRQNRVVLAPVAGVKPPEAGEAQPGFARPSIRRRWRQEEFVSRESAA